MPKFHGREFLHLQGNLILPNKCYHFYYKKKPKQSFLLKIKNFVPMAGLDYGLIIKMRAKYKMKKIQNFVPMAEKKEKEGSTSNMVSLHSPTNLLTSTI